MNLETIMSSRPIILAQAAITEVKSIINKIITTAVASIKEMIGPQDIPSSAERFSALADSADPIAKNLERLLAQHSQPNESEQSDDSALDGLKTLFTQDDDTKKVEQDTSSSTEDPNALIDSADVILKNLEALLARFQYDETEDVDADIDMEEIPQK